jgi:hypothetical protein
MCAIPAHKQRRRTRLLERLALVTTIGAAATALVASPSALSQSIALEGHIAQVAQAPCEGQPGRIIECVRPSATDPHIRRFDYPHYVIYSGNAEAAADLLVFMTGTGGRPPGPQNFLEEAVEAGYRVISIAYNDTPAVNVYCPMKPDPMCAEHFRHMRIYGDNTLTDGAVDNPLSESIVNRLIKLLQFLDHNHPDVGWAGYLDNGSLNWQRIAFAGQSQGAGMAAFIAKEHEVRRVILFSSPWDFLNENGKGVLAPWLSTPSVTPSDRWFGGYHAREATAEIIAKAYAALKVPPSHIRIFNEQLAPKVQTIGGSNPFHGEGISNPAYKAERLFFLQR